MAYLPRGMVEAGIKTRTRTDRRGNPHVDFEAYFGIDPFTHRPVRLTRTDRDELMSEIREFYRRHSFGGDAAVRLTAMQSIDAKNALDAIASAQASFSLLDAVNSYIGGQACILPSVNVADAYKRYYDAKPEGSDKIQTKATIGKWASQNGDRALQSISAKEVAEYLDSRYGDKKPKTYNSHLLYLKTFFNWCCKDERKYLATNPIKSLKYREEPWEEPEYMKPEDVERLFRLLEEVKETRPELLAQAIISFFTGARAVEIRRMAAVNDAAKINLEDETIRIAKGKGFQRGRRPRAFHIEPTAIAWMTCFDFTEAVKKITKKTIDDIYKLARANKIPVFKNCGRHTFITYHVAAYGDPTKTTAMAGTSDKMRAENYCGLASKADGLAYFKILPKKV